MGTAILVVSIGLQILAIAFVCFCFYVTFKTFLHLWKDL